MRSLMIHRRETMIRFGNDTFTVDKSIDSVRKEHEKALREGKFIKYANDGNPIVINPYQVSSLKSLD